MSAVEDDDDRMRSRGLRRRDESVQPHRHVAEAALLREAFLDDGRLAQVVFDRGGFRYHGRVKALAEAAREAGLKF